MNHITPAEFGKVMRKMTKESGIKKQVNNTSRIAGWGNSTPGISYTYPRFDWSYYRNNRKVRDYSKDVFEEMEVHYSAGTYRSYAEQAERDSARFAEEFRKHVPSDVYEERNGEFFVRVTNKFHNDN